MRIEGGVCAHVGERARLRGPAPSRLSPKPSYLISLGSANLFWRNRLGLMIKIAEDPHKAPAAARVTAARAFDGAWWGMSCTAKDVGNAAIGAC